MCWFVICIHLKWILDMSINYLTISCCFIAWSTLDVRCVRIQSHHQIRAKQHEPRTIYCDMVINYFWSSWVLFKYIFAHLYMCWVTPCSCLFLFLTLSWAWAWFIFLHCCKWNCIAKLSVDISNDIKATLEYTNRAALNRCEIWSKSYANLSNVSIVIICSDTFSVLIEQ